MSRTASVQLRLPAAPRAIQKGSTLKDLLDREAIDCLAHNLRLVHPRFDAAAFRRTARKGLAPLSILRRGEHLARALRTHLPPRYEDAIAVLLRSLTPPQTETEDLGLAVFFYLPHVSFVAAYGLDPEHNDGRDPFEVSMRAQYELTRRFSAEFSIRPFLIRHPERTLARLREWTRDPDPHVRRLCSEGTRPRLPWAMRIPAFIKDPRPTLPILEALKDDPDLYVRRSVANHLGDIAKDHPALVFDLCERWRKGAPDEQQMAYPPCPAPSGKEGCQGRAATATSGRVGQATRPFLRACLETLPAHGGGLGGVRPSSGAATWRGRQARTFRARRKKFHSAAPRPDSSNTL